MHIIQHTHIGYNWALASPTTSSLWLWCTPVSENGYKRIWAQNEWFPILFREYGQHSNGTDLILYCQGPSVVWCYRIPWGQWPGSGLETLLLETEVLGVDLSVWLSTWGFCTSRKRWKGSYSSLLCWWVLGSCLYNYILPGAILAEAPVFILCRYRTDW